MREEIEVEITYMYVYMYVYEHMYGNVNVKRNGKSNNQSDIKQLLIYFCYLVTFKNKHCNSNSSKYRHFYQMISMSEFRISTLTQATSLFPNTARETESRICRFCE